MKQEYRISAALAVLALAGMLSSQSASPLADHAALPDSKQGDAAAESPAEQAGNASYVIGEDDVLAINVWNEPDLKQSLPVRPDGKISLPLVGDIQAAGRTPSQLQEDITAKLKTFITHPDVAIVVQQIKSKKFNILGRVAKPGSYSLATTITVLDAIAEAGGFQDFAKQKDIYILRENPGGSVRRFRFNYKEVVKGKNREQNIRLEPNDTIIVP